MFTNMYLVNQRKTTLGTRLEYSMIRSRIDGNYRKSIESSNNKVTTVSTGLKGLHFSDTFSFSQDVFNGLGFFQCLVLSEVLSD